MGESEWHDAAEGPWGGSNTGSYADPNTNTNTHTDTTTETDTAAKTDATSETYSAT